MTHRFYVKLNRIIGINLVLWLATAGTVSFEDAVPSFEKVIAWVGCAFAALIQHWAYYADKREPSEISP